uniref:Uncharacterized protein n=1 Tax=Oryza meridionalis TaxID=40149 RepID=A0A0E0DLD2_9ORYZ
QPSRLAIAVALPLRPSPRRCPAARARSLVARLLRGCAASARRHDAIARPACPPASCLIDPAPGTARQIIKTKQI